MNLARPFKAGIEGAHSCHVGLAGAGDDPGLVVIVKANKDSEAGVMPSEELLTEMGTFNEELVKAGLMLAGEGLRSLLAKGGQHEIKSISYI